MLGNWVEYATGLNKEKRSIPMYVTGIFSDTVYLNFDGNEGDVFDEEEKNLLGIPITEDLLEKCGFYINKDVPNNRLFILGDVILVFDSNRSVIHNEDQCIENISFLHELQNSYRMITKKELEVKL